MKKRYNVKSAGGFIFQYYDSQLERQVNYAVPGDIVEVYNNCVDILIQGQRVMSLNLLNSVANAVNQGILEEIV
jgi:hypothetical protein